MVMLLICYALLRLVHRLATHSLIEIYLMTIELWAINAGEESLATHTHTARATHTCTIHHQGVERYGSRELILAGCERHELHHNHRADSHALVVVLTLIVNQILNLGSHHTLETSRAVVGCDIEVVGNLLHLLGVDEH